MTSDKRLQKFHTDDVSLPRSGLCSRLVLPRGNLLQPIRSTTQICVVTRHQYGISALLSQTSFHGDTSGGIAKCGRFSKATRGKIDDLYKQASPQKAKKVYFRYLQLYSNSELKNGDSIMLSICKVQASNKDPAVTAAETGNQRSFGNGNTPEK